MGSIFRRNVTRPVPDGATITRDRSGTETAKWTPRNASRPITAIVRTLPDGRRVVDQESPIYVCRYRDADGYPITRSTGCRDRAAAEQFLAKIEKDAQRIKAGVVTRAEQAVADHAASKIGGHIDDYAQTLNGRHAKNTSAYLRKLAESLNWRTLADLRRDDLQLWSAAETKAGRSARSTSAYLVAAIGFGTWLVDVRRINANPFARMPKPPIEADRRHVRRALTADELARLIQAAQNSPGRPPSRRDGKPDQNTRQPPERLTGHSRGLLYAVLAGTGLRVGEAGKLRVRDLDLDGDRPGIRLSAAITKNRKEDYLPLRADLADLLQAETAGRKPDDRVLATPACLVKRFHADCKRAGIPHVDDRGRVLDLHALRTTFITSLAVAGVPLVVAQKLARHADPKLTAVTYTDVGLLDLHAAVESVPAASPTEVSVVRSVVRSVVSTPDFGRLSPAHTDTNDDANPNAASA